MKTQLIKYASAVTFGRFNICHSGHVELVKQMLHYAEYADVHISGSNNNNEYQMRELLFRVLLRADGVDLSRVNFYETASITEAMKLSIKNAPYNECVLILGSDQVDMGRSIADFYDCFFIINSRSNSSTQMRYFLDSYEFIEDAKYLYNGNEYATTLAFMLRKEEKDRTKSAKVREPVPSGGWHGGGFVL